MSSITALTHKKTVRTARTRRRAARWIALGLLAICLALDTAGAAHVYAHRGRCAANCATCHWARNAATGVRVGVAAAPTLLTRPACVRPAVAVPRVSRRVQSSCRAPPSLVASC